MKNIVVWHRRDLRTEDNRALTEAAKSGNPRPVFIIDPLFFGDKQDCCNDRLLFLLQCIEDLDHQYKKLGSSLALLFGKSIDKIIEIKEKYNARVYFNLDTNSSYGFERDEELLKLDGVSGFSNDAIIREDFKREEWHKNCKAFYDQDTVSAPDSLHQNTINSEITTKELIEKYGLKGKKVKVPPGGTSEAKKRVAEFIRNYREYPKSISKPHLAEKYTSRLSAHFSLGSVSPRMVFREITDTDIKNKQFFLTRLFWNQHFTQKYEDFKKLDSETVNPVFDEQRDKIYDHNEEYIEAWKTGNTGYPMVDASMRALLKTGFINFRMRAMLASFFCYILRQYWKIGADHMYYHLIDADRAINYSQWQMQAGTVGAHPNRIYNPAKQVYDNDPEGDFIREYVPELKEFKTVYLATPWLIPEEDQENAGVIIGKDYPLPVVDFKKEYKKTRKIYSEINRLAREKLKEPRIHKRASLSGIARKRVMKKDNSVIKEV